jgi:hypothetical protein
MLVGAPEGTDAGGGDAGQYQIRRDTYQYSFELASIVIDDRTNKIEGFSQIASCRAAEEDSSHEGGAPPKLVKWNWDTLPLSECSKDGGEMSVVIDGLRLVYSVQSVLGIYNFWFVPREDRFSRALAAGAPCDAPAHPALTAEELAHELCLWRDRTQYDKRLKWQVPKPETRNPKPETRNPANILLT